jgi:hypothetical protein
LTSSISNGASLIHQTAESQIRGQENCSSTDQQGNKYQCCEMFHHSLPLTEQEPIGAATSGLPSLALFRQDHLAFHVHCMHPPHPRACSGKDEPAPNLFSNAFSEGDF